MNRKIVQIAVAAALPSPEDDLPDRDYPIYHDRLYALCDDGTTWLYSNLTVLGARISAGATVNGFWVRIPAIPAS